MLKIRKKFNTIVIGLTGNIGAGKSYVAGIFRKMGIPVFDSDNEARALLYSDENIGRKIRSSFGDVVFSDDNKPDRKKLASIVFSDKAKLEVLNSIIHPAVRKRFREWTVEQGAALVIKEAAILIESGSADIDKIILVTSPIEKRIERVMMRDQVNREDVLKRMNNQMPEEEKIRYADFIIVNDGDKALLPQVGEILNELRKVQN